MNPKRERVVVGVLSTIVVGLGGVFLWAFIKTGTISVPWGQATEPPAQTVEVPHYQNAVNQAMNAATLTQSAKTPDEWQKIVDAWNGAIASFQQVPNTHPNYATAQQKIGEYQKNLAYAQQRLAKAQAQAPAPQPVAVVPTPVGDLPGIQYLAVRGGQPVARDPVPVAVDFASAQQLSAAGNSHNQQQLTALLTARKAVLLEGATTVTVLAVQGDFMQVKFHGWGANGEDFSGQVFWVDKLFVQTQEIN